MAGLLLTIWGRRLFGYCRTVRDGVVVCAVVRGRAAISGFCLKKQIYADPTIKGKTGSFISLFAIRNCR
jgi:hypothetical protein